MTNMLFTNVRIIDGSGAPPFAGDVLVQGNRILRVGRGTRVDPDRRRHGDRRRRRHLDAGHGRGAHALLLERRRDPRRHPAHAARGARAVVGRRGAALSRGGLHLLRRRRLRQAAARRGDPQCHQFGHDPRPALPRGQPGDHRGRRPRRRDAGAPAVSRVQLRRGGQRPRGDAQGGAHVPQVRRRHHQAQSVGRQLRRQCAGRDDLDERRGGRHRRLRDQEARQARVVPCPVLRIDQAGDAPRHRHHLSRELHRRGSARHARGAARTRSSWRPASASCSP